MKPLARGLVVALPAVLCAAAWLPSGGQADPVAGLAAAVVRSAGAEEALRVALAQLEPGKWSVAPDAEVAGAGVRRYRVACTKPASRTNPPLSGLVSVSVAAGRALGWATLLPGKEPGAALERHERAGALANALFEIHESGSAPVYPNAAEFLRRLQAGVEVGAPRWELPAEPRSGAPIAVSTSEAPGPLFSEGLVLLALLPTDERNRAVADRFAAELAGRLAAGAAIPTPRLGPSRATWSMAYRSQRDLRTGDLPLEEAVAKLRAPGSAPAEGLAVSGLSARIRALLDGPEKGQISAVLESMPEGIPLRAALPAGSREAEHLARLPRGGAEGEGALVWSGRIAARAVVPYAGEVWELRDFAFEWRPAGM